MSDIYAEILTISVMNNILHKRSSLGANWGNVILGIWVAVSPFVLGFAEIPAALWNCIGVGSVVALLAFSRRTGRRLGNNLNVLLGLWLVVSPFALRVFDRTPYWNSILLGI